jgi:flagellar motor switch protein FliM
LHLFGMAPLRGQCLLAVSPPLAFGLVDRLCGGAGRAPEGLEAREYSAIETQVLERIATRVLAELGEAWTPVQRVDCRLLRTEVNATQIMLAAPSEMVLALDLACDLGAGAAPLIVALPYAALEPLKGRLGEPKVEAAAVAGDREWRGAIAAAIHLAEVTVSAELGTCDVPARHVLGLRVGDLLDLGTRGDDPVTLRIDGVRLMKGLAGVSRGQNAVRVLGRAQGEGGNDGR